MTNIATVFTVVVLLSSCHGNPAMRKIQRTINHLFSEMGKFRLELSMMNFRLDEIEENIGNLTDMGGEGNSQMTTDTGNAGQPAGNIADAQNRDGCADKCKAENHKDSQIKMDMVLKSLFKEKLRIRDMLKSVDDVVRNGAIGQEVEERLRIIEDRIEDIPNGVNNEGNNMAPAVVVRDTDIKYSFSAKLDKSLDIAPNPRAKLLGHTMHSKRLVYGDVIHNDGNVYNPTTGKFTCKKDGVYLFVFFVEGMFRSKHHVSKQTSMIALSVDGKFQTLAASKALSADGRNTGGNSVILSLTKGQQVWLETVAPISQIITLREWVSTFTGTLLY